MHRITPQLDLLTDTIFRILLFFCIENNNKLSANIQVGVLFYSYRENIKDVEKIKRIYFLFKDDISEVNLKMYLVQGF